MTDKADLVDRANGRRAGIAAQGGDLTAELPGFGLARRAFDALQVGKNRLTIAGSGVQRRGD